MNNIIYPFSPKNPDKRILKPSANYRTEATKVILSILLFVLIYLLLVAVVIGFAIIVSYLGIELIVLKPMFITLMIGIGMIGLGIMVFYFLIKFIFTRNKIDRSRYTEINEKDYPELFSFIRKLSNETRTPMPKRIYLSPDVNASVFYDSSFLSLFFPVKKNLLIGLGFVNSVNLSEFKAVIAHEFGHFSQHSMRLGSYVYNVNKIIYNMLYDNDGYANVIEKWAEVNNYFTFFAKLTVKIVESIQWVLQKVYVVVNKSNLRLSRQMEHHADAVSAYVCGPQHIVNALKRLELSDGCYNILLDKYDKWISDSYKPDNLFVQHKLVLEHLAVVNNYQTEDGLAIFDGNILQSNKSSRIVIKDQWSTHPSTIERETFVKSLNIEETQKVTQNAWVLFNNTEKVQKQVTEKLFSKVKYTNEVKTLDFESFNEKFKTDFVVKTFNNEYKGFYNNRRIKVFDINYIEEKPANIKFENLFTSESCEMPKELEIIDSDLNILKSIQNQQSNIGVFEFDEKKYTTSDIPALIEQLENEKKELEAQIEKIDKNIFSVTLSKAEDKDKMMLQSLYSEYFKISAESESGIEKYNELTKTISPIYVKKLPIEEAKTIMGNVKHIETQIIQQIQDIIAEVLEFKYLNDSQLEKIDSYLSKDRPYFENSRFNNVELDVFNEAMNLFITMLYEREFSIKKQLLQLQLDILQRN